MNNTTTRIVSGLVTIVTFVGLAIYKKYSSEARISVNFDDDHINEEKKFLDIWRNNRRHFRRMWISEDERYSFGPHHTRRYSFYTDEQGLSLLDGFVINF